MKKLLILLLILKAGSSQAQDTLTSFYDISWKLSLPQMASYYSMAIKEDTIWRGYFFYMSNDKLHSRGFYLDKTLQTPTGPYSSYDSLGHISSQGYYLKGKKYGTWKYWYPEGNLSDSVFYLGGIKHFARSYQKNGSIQEMIDTDSSGMTYMKSFWSNGNLKMEGGLVQGKKHGLWKVHVPHDDLIQEVTFIKDSVVAVHCRNTKGLKVKDCIYEKDAEVKGGASAWKSYLVAALTSYLKMRATDDCEGKVVVQFIVDKDGKIIEPRVVASSNPELNNIALQIIQRSPRWNPAIQYNQKVKAYRLQPITFKCPQ
jgi:TonB family protein